MTNEFGRLHPHQLQLMMLQRLRAATSEMQMVNRLVAEMHNATDAASDVLNQVNATEESLQTAQEAEQRTRRMSKAFGAAITAAKERYGSNDPGLAFVYEVAAEYFSRVNVPALEETFLSCAAEARRGAHRVKPEIASRQLALAETLTKLAAVYARHHKHILARDTSAEALYHYEHNLAANHADLIQSRQNAAYYQSLVPKDS